MSRLNLYTSDIIIKIKIMTNIKTPNIDEETITRLGLRLSDKHVNCDPSSRVFEYPHLDEVFIMESDLYGNKMPQDSCFLAFNGNHGMIGKHLYVETLKKSSVSDIQRIVQANVEG